MFTSRSATCDRHRLRDLNGIGSRMLIRREAAARSPGRPPSLCPCRDGERRFNGQPRERGDKWCVLLAKNGPNLYLGDLSDRWTNASRARRTVRALVQVGPVPWTGGGTGLGRANVFASAVAWGTPIRRKISAGRLTQRLECYPHTVEVTGSNPVTPTSQVE